MTLRKNKFSILYSFIANYVLVVFLIMLFVFTIFYTLILNTYNSNVTTDSLNKLLRSSAFLDNEFSNCIDTSQKITADYNLHPYSIKKDSTSSQAVNSLSNMRSFDSIISNIIVLYDDPEIFNAYSSNGTIEYNYFDECYQLNNLPYNSIKELSKRLNLPTLFRIDDNLNIIDNTNRIVLFLPGSYFDKPFPEVIIFLINYNSVAKIFSEPFEDTNYISLIVDNNNNIIFSDGNHIPEYNIDYVLNEINLNSDEDIIKVNKNTNAYILNSRVLDLKYIVLSENNTQLSEMIRYGRWSLYGLLIILLFSLCVSYFLAKSSFKPILQLKNHALKLQSILPNQDIANTKNELFLINQIFLAIEHDKELLPESAPKNMPQTYYMFTSLLSGNFNSLHQDDIHNMFSINYKNTAFIMLLFSIDNKKDFINSFTMIQRQRIYTDYINMISDMLKPVAAPLFSLAPATNNTIVLVPFNLPEQDEMINRIINTVNVVQQSVIDKYEISISVSKSNIYQNIKESQRVMYMLIRAAKYKFLTGDSSIIDIENENLSTHFIDMQTNILVYDLYQALLENNIDSANMIIDNIFNILESSYSPHVFASIYMSILSVFKNINKNIIHNDEFDEYLNTNINYDPETITETRNIIEQCISVLASSRETSLDQKAILKAEVLSFIAKEYRDPNLSLYLISKHLNVSTSYLSKFIKKTIGVNFTTYVNSLRINKAKELLAKTNLSIRKIATQVGYYDISNFNRQFKVYENMTPSQYHLNNYKEDTEFE